MSMISVVCAFVSDVSPVLGWMCLLNDLIPGILLPFLFSYFVKDASNNQLKLVTMYTAYCELDWIGALKLFTECPQFLQ
ncbi:hypothetical protein VNO78_04003 [Psophocarpus tetragonolobus]|uniref:Uncharacterized protein n=1 Tax=Psophocarpus tetragonolobus TaxID=3891 RepID=A0AAN9T428_PSOTE